MASKNGLGKPKPNADRTAHRGSKEFKQVKRADSTKTIVIDKGLLHENGSVKSNHSMERETRADSFEDSDINDHRLMDTHEPSRAINGAVNDTPDATKENSSGEMSTSTNSSKEDNDPSHREKGTPKTRQGQPEENGIDTRRYSVDVRKKSIAPIRRDSVIVKNGMKKKNNIPIRKMSEVKPIQSQRQNQLKRQTSRQSVQASVSQPKHMQKRASKDHGAADFKRGPRNSLPEEDEDAEEERGATRTLESGDGRGDTRMMSVEECDDDFFAREEMNTGINEWADIEEDVRVT